jgi:tRNA/tmRNA/rRNA uracil-C5-methylase (TrmA/RlmC/RlmD family)
MAHYKLKADKQGPAKQSPRDGKIDFRKGSPAKREATERREEVRGGRDFGASPNRPQGNHATRKIARFTEQTRRGFGPRRDEREDDGAVAFPASKGRRVRESPAARQSVRERPAYREAAPTGYGKSANDFSALMRDTARGMGLSDRLDPEPAPLALLDYKTELEVKNAAIRAWWKQHEIPDKPSLVVPSPLHRHYRSTSKRRPVRQGDRWRWDFFLERLGGVAKAGIDTLEPASHEAVYKFALEKLNEDAYRGLANSLNFLIVRGGEELMVVFNVFRLGPEVVRKAKMLAEHLAKIPGTKVVAAHIFFDKTRSDYYIEAKVSEGAFRLKRLFGPEFLPINVEGRRFLLHPTGFFQVNISILPRVIGEVGNALKPQPDDRLIDLYCGCGLFTLPVAAACAEAFGIEGSPVSIEAAKKIALRNTRFTASRIDSKTLQKLLPPPDGRPEILLLDPPRQGTAAGVIPMLAERKPRRVAYLFCDMNTLPEEVKKWRKQGYMIAKALPFDMFPGTYNLEMLVVLIPDKYGILNRKKIKVDAVDEPANETRREAPKAAGKAAGNGAAKVAGKGAGKGPYRGKKAEGEQRTSRKAPGRPRRRN